MIGGSTQAICDPQLAVPRIRTIVCWVSQKERVHVAGDLKSRIHVVSLSKQNPFTLPTHVVPTWLMGCTKYESITQGALGSPVTCPTPLGFCQERSSGRCLFDTSGPTKNGRTYGTAPRPNDCLCPREP